MKNPYTLNRQGTEFPIHSNDQKIFLNKESRQELVNASKETKTVREKKPIKGASWESFKVKIL